MHWKHDSPMPPPKKGNTNSYFVHGFVQFEPKTAERRETRKSKQRQILQDYKKINTVESGSWVSAREGELNAQQTPEQQGVSAMEIQ
jgi:hypothetical protein